MYRALAEKGAAAIGSGPLWFLRLSRFACSRRPASLRLGLEPPRCAGLGSRPRSGPSGLLTTAPRFFLLQVEEGVHAQVLSLVVAKSTPVGTPRHGHSSFRSLAPPLPTRPAAKPLGSCGGPVPDSYSRRTAPPRRRRGPEELGDTKTGPLPLAAAP